MNTKYILIFLAAAAAMAGGRLAAQTSNLVSYVNIGSSANSGTGDPLRTAFAKINNDLGLLGNVIDTNAGAGISGIRFTNTATLAAGSSATATNYGVVGGLAYISLGIPQGVQGPPNTNALYPTVESTLTNINPLYCTGSNYIGYFPQLFDWSFQLPNTTVGMSLGTNLNENLCGSLDGVNWFTLSNSPSAIFTNIYISVSGDNNTNYAGALTLYSLSNSQYYNQTNQFVGQHCEFGTPTLPGDAVNLSTMQQYVNNAVGSVWQTVVDTNGVSHYRYSPYGQIDVDLVANVATGMKITGFRPSGTNWLLSVTNLPSGYQIQSSTNLLNYYGWATLPTSSYTLTTNVPTITATIPQYLIPTSYAFFRVVVFASSAATFTPPVTFNSGTIYTSNSWSLATITNGMANGGFWEGNSNGAALVSLWLSNGIPVIKQIAP